MKKSAIKVVILASSTMVLAACNNGGGDSDTVVKLETQSDSLRELGLSIGNGGLLSQFINFPAGEATARSKQLGAKAVDPANCDTIKGTDSYQEGAKDRDFKLLNPAVSAVRVQFSGYTKDNYQEQDCSGEDNENITLLQAGGATENGYGESETGEYSYSTYGSGDKPSFQLMEDYEGGELINRQLMEYLGTFERLDSEEDSEATSTYAMILRLKSEYFQQDGQDIKVAFGMGDGNEPLRAKVKSGSFQLDGSYHYSTNVSTCAGGKVQVSTPSEGGIKVSENRLTGGELRLVSGGSTARFTFKEDGGATLVINGGTAIELTAQEVLTARQSVAPECSQEDTDL